MAVFDTGPIDNRNAPRTTQLTIRLLKVRLGNRTVYSLATIGFPSALGEEKLY